MMDKTRIYSGVMCKGVLKKVGDKWAFQVLSWRVGDAKNKEVVKSVEFDTYNDACSATLAYNIFDASNDSKVTWVPA